MPRINLISGERREKASRRIRVPSSPISLRESWVPTSPTFITGLVALGVLLVCVFLYFGERRALAQTGEAIVEAQSDSSRLHDAVSRVRSLEEAQVRLAGRVQVMSQVVEGRLFWIDLMESLSVSLPDYTWLEKIDQEDLAADQIRISGGTFANAAVTDYMRALEASSELTDVTLVGVSRVEKEGVEYQSFALVSTFEGYTPVVLGPADATPKD